ncbi:MAG: ABC transporter permease subunit [Bacteriovoracales bacterium]|nr:ABC transporter permease subunit [Bacteriovoracales bacterium]
MTKIFVRITFLTTCLTVFSATAQTIRVGSKPFTESNILAEIMAQILIRDGVEIERKYNMGGTGIIYRSLKEGLIDLYPEYTGTLAKVILKLKGDDHDWNSIQKELNRRGLVMSRPFGFNNTYVLAARKETAKRYGLDRLSDLGSLSGLSVAFDPEFTSRRDGALALFDTYRLSFKDQQVMEHTLLYEAIAHKKVDLIDAYSTDPKIRTLDLKILEDDRGAFPAYLGVILTTRRFIKKYPKLWRSLTNLESKITNDIITDLNSKVEIHRYTYDSVARLYLEEKTVAKSQYDHHLEKIPLYLFEHLQLSLIPLLASALVGIALGIMGTFHRWVAQFILLSSGLLQTIPSLALLCLLIPLVGIGAPAAYFAIFAYGILPITRNTFLGLSSIPNDLMDYSRSIGLSRMEQLRFIQLPLAQKAILAGLKTSSVINVGNATLAAFIGGGGLGVVIVTGLTLNDQSLILLGAFSASFLALIFHFAFEILDRILTIRSPGA